ncbi:MFS transporter [Arsenicicoccus dermatophilus]|uniref:MFS transporter n=1 Tax=Arsenicicoccus dermatophilus TaxID=1076331 RepID=UPI001F4CFAE0|nr:MFS transporter [Arsenicicoccus dermatophilus]MCH8612178.1 MFS transporter [Arsenicicoccus dermatophilus]
MLRHFGFPPVGDHRRFVVALTVDAIGSGVFMPLSMLYFLRTTDLRLEQVGAAVSIAAAVALPVVLLVGQLVDRLGPRSMLLAANAIQATAYAGFLLVHDVAGMQTVTILAALGQACFWGSFGPMLAAITREGERELWYGFVGALRNLGFAVGGLVAGLVIAVGTTTAYHGVVVANAVSFALALVLLADVPVQAPARTAGQHPLAGLGMVLRDAPYAVLLVANLGYALCGLALNYAMPVYAADRLQLPGWVTGAIYTLNTVLVGLGQGLVVRAMTGHRRHRVLALAGVAFVVGFGLLAVAGRAGAGLASAVVLVAVAVYTLGELLGGPVLSTVAVDSRPAELRGTYLSAYQLSWNVAGIIGPAAFAWLLGRGDEPVWLALAASSVVGIAVTPLLARVLPVAGERVTNQAA